MLTYKMKKLLTICLMLLGVVAQAQNFAITATTEAAIRKNIVKGNASNYGFGMINDTLKLVGLTTRNVIFTGTIGKSGVGLGNVDNTSDANKPVSTATQTALNLKANIASPTFTGTVSGITKSMVGLGNVDNTTDVSKPISTATQTALDLKLTSTTAASTYLPISNPTSTGTLTAPTIANSLGATFATSSGNVGIGTSSPANKLDVSGTVRVTGTTQINGNVGIGAAPSTQSLVVYSTANDIAFQAINTKTTGSNYGVAGNSQGSGATLNMGGFFYADGAATNHGIRVFNITAAANNYSLFIDSPAKSYFQGSVLIGVTTDAGYKLDVNGTAQATQFKLNALNTAPASTTATGIVGEIRIDENYIYICTATNTWKRSVITTW
jgi:hypothetical protein